MSPLDDADLAAMRTTVAACAQACRTLSWTESLKVFGEAGILGALADERVGGLAMAPAAGAAIAGAAGRVLFADAIVEAMLAARYAASIAPDVAAAIVSGALPCIVSPGGSVTLDERGRLSGFVGPAPFGHEAARLLVVADTAAGPRLALVDLDGGGVRRRAVDTLDLERPHGTIDLDGVTPVAVDAERAAECRGLCLALRAAWLEANARQALQIAVDQLAVREQFGRTLIAMPVVRHGVARLGLGLENARLLTGDALARLSWPAAALAFAESARVSIEVVEKALHYLGAMGFTWEVPVHRHLRRIRATVDCCRAGPPADAAGLLADFAASRSEEPELA